ncbi:unnamed protein product [Periconia digitata]|uniref:Major facilitator superfamily (MFS) profile domain-containing protein n=1 Tax=Periconia digitata TaxID=1303443 RepID=A0A9W4UEQ8_9PLEO|nr:unnamed protein product [Periconia digitata]
MVASSTSPKHGTTTQPQELAQMPPAHVTNVDTSPTSKRDPDHDPFLVEFTPGFDVRNPKDWTTSRKWSVTDVLSASGFNRIMVSTIMAPALTTIAHELEMSPTESALALSIYLLASAFGPIFIGPLSEVYGRQTVLHVTGVWFLAWNAACGFAKNKETLIASRFLAGFGASSIYALAGGVLGDIWGPEQRGRSLGLYLLIPIIGAAVGPIIGGFMAGRTTWRWMFWSTSIFQAVMVLVSFGVFRETYAPVILKRRAAMLRRTTGDSRYYTIHERMEESHSLAYILAKAFTRPMRLLLLQPLVQTASLISALSYGILYILLSSFSDLWIQHYNMSVEMSGLHYIALAAGELTSSTLGGYLLDSIYSRMKARDPENELEPEHRLPFALPGYLLSVLALVFYGWTAQFRVHWIAVDIAIFLVSFGLQLAGLPQQAYVMDVYQEHTSSALAASQFPRSLAAFLFPLFAPAMYRSLGYGWANSVLALLGLMLGLPGSIFFWRWGKRMRMKFVGSY